MSTSTLKAIDLKHLWHPFTQSRLWEREADPLIVDRAEGFELIDVEGRRYLDGISSLWCNVHGHAVPELLSAIETQAKAVCHSTLLGLSHRPAIELSERLIRKLPAGLTRIFFADSGSTAVEAGLRMGLEWWQKQGTAAGKRKRKLLSLETGYHGDTLGAVGVGYVKSFHRALESNVVPALRVPPPHQFRFYEGLSEEDATAASISALDKLLQSEAGEIAAFIIEPMVQGAAGIWPHAADYLRAVRELCTKYEIFMIADEVATGFAKTGKMFAIEQAGITPDILILGKGLSGGYLPISAAIASEQIFSGFLGEADELKTFFYGQTFAGNPLAAAVASANLDLFDSSKLLERLPERIQLFHQELDKHIAPLSHVDEIRRNGLMVGIELTKTAGKREAYSTAELAGARITREARNRGLIIRPLGNVMVLMPAAAMPAEELKRVVELTKDAIEAALGA